MMSSECIYIYVYVCIYMYTYMQHPAPGLRLHHHHTMKLLAVAFTDVADISIPPEPNPPSQLLKPISSNGHSVVWQLQVLMRHYLQRTSQPSAETSTCVTTSRSQHLTHTRLCVFQFSYPSNAMTGSTSSPETHPVKPHLIDFLQVIRRLDTHPQS